MLKEGGHEEKNIPRDEDDPELIGFSMPKPLPIVPDVVEYFCYVYCFVGLLTGPFFRLCTFRHAVWRGDTATLPTLRASFLRLAPFPLYAFVNFVSTLFNLSSSTVHDSHQSRADLLIWSIPLAFYVVSLEGIVVLGSEVSY